MASSSGTGREYPAELVHGELCRTRFNINAPCDCGKSEPVAAESGTGHDTAQKGACFCGAFTHVSLVSDGDQGECGTEFTVIKDDPECPTEWWPCPKCGNECEVEWSSGPADLPVAVPEWTCASCGSHRWVAVSLNGGRTRNPQCVPCGRIGGKIPTLGEMENAVYADDPEFDSRVAEDIHADPPHLVWREARRRENRCECDTCWCAFIRQGVPADLPVAAPAQYAWTFECGHATIGPNSDPPDACPVCGDISLWRKSPSLPVAAPDPAQTIRHAMDVWRGGGTMREAAEAALESLLAALRVTEERNERLAAYAESVAALGDAISVEYQDIVEAARAVLAVEEEK